MLLDFNIHKINKTTFSVNKFRLLLDGIRNWKTVSVVYYHYQSFSLIISTSFDTSMLLTKTGYRYLERNMGHFPSWGIPTRRRTKAILLTLYKRISFGRTVSTSRMCLTGIHASSAYFLHSPRYITDSTYIGIYIFPNYKFTAFVIKARESGSHLRIV